MSARSDRVLFGIERRRGWTNRHTVAESHLCAACRQRRARFRYRGVVKADTDHTLCFRCYRALRDRLRTAYLRASVFRVTVPHR